MENAAMIEAILAGDPGARRDIAVVNAAAALLAGGRASEPREAIEIAADSIDSGRAATVLEKLRKKFPV